jgi:GDP-fucose protein O-fucosyltransferase
MLRALGFGDDVHLYVASGEVYGGEVTLAPLKALFPNIHSKETLLNRDELAPFEPFSSRMAALDFIVCDESDVFVTNNNGNMARILAGRRQVHFNFFVCLFFLLFEGLDFWCYVKKKITIKSEVLNKLSSQRTK